MEKILHEVPTTNGHSESAEPSEPKPKAEKNGIIESAKSAIADAVNGVNGIKLST